MWHVYIVRCADGTLYTGATTDPAARVQKHNNGSGAKYTRSRTPVELVYLEGVGDHGDALRREHQLRKLSASQKQAIIAEAGLVELS